MPRTPRLQSLRIRWLPNVIGLPPTVSQAFDLSGVFATVTLPGNPDINISTMMIDGCEVTTLESTNTFNQNDLPTIDILDPGAPGKADNGSTEVNLERMVFDGFEKLFF